MNSFLSKRGIIVSCIFVAMEVFHAANISKGSELIPAKCKV